MATHPPRVGLQTAPQSIAWEEMVRIWQQADAAGYDSLWTFDHFLPIFADPTGPQMEGWTTLAALAALTKRARVGCLVTGNTYRHPAVLAKIASTVDHISGGRLNFGLGAGWFEYEHQVHGWQFPEIPERLKRFAEALELTVRLWTEEAASFDGKFYTLDGAPHEPKPVQKPHPPIMIGGGGEKVLLKLVAKYAQMWNCPGGLNLLTHKRDILHGHCETVGRDPAEIELTSLTRFYVTKDDAAARAFIDQWAGSAMLSEEEAAEQFLVGSPERCIENAHRYFDAGITHIILLAPRPFDHDSFALFTEDVLPHLKT